MPERPAPEVCKVVQASLRQTHSPAKTLRELQAQHPGPEYQALTIQQVRQEADVARIEKKRGPAVGEGKGGRPPGKGTTFSPYRDTAYLLFSKGKSPVEVTAELGIKRQQTYLFHAEWRLLSVVDKK